ncbi:MAG: GNAT family N-acetyltransferase [Clostridiales bacterium]|nr:GNAT family N-acetyltransferase [Clostridiales bacterium]
MNKYRLVKLCEDDMECFELLYNWIVEEENRDHHTCRPIKEMGSLSDYITAMKHIIGTGVQAYILQTSETKEVLGKITLFDYNPRNHSAEFGYYLPKQHRGKGYGQKMLQLFLNLIFNDETIELNKVYATTASNNEGSVKILEKEGFCLDGTIREHYWINDRIYDQLHYSLLKREYSDSKIGDR